MAKLDDLFKEIGAIKLLMGLHKDLITAYEVQEFESLNDDIIKIINSSSEKEFIRMLKNKFLPEGGELGARAKLALIVTREFRKRLADKI